MNTPIRHMTKAEFDKEYDRLAKEYTEKGKPFPTKEHALQLTFMLGQISMHKYKELLGYDPNTQQE